MKIGLHLAPSQSRLWIKRLAHRLQTEHSSQLIISQAYEDREQAQSAMKVIEHLMAYEAWLFQSRSARRAKEEASEIPCDDRFSAALHIPLQELNLGTLSARNKADICLDLTSDPEMKDCADNYEHTNCDSGCVTLSVLFDGQAGEQALIAAALKGHMPQIALQNLFTGEIVATASPSAELAAGVSGILDQAYMRLITLLLAWLSTPRRTTQNLAILDHGPSPSLAQVIKFAAKNTLRHAVMSVYRKLFYASHWRIGWRWSEEASDVWARRDMNGGKWSILPDVGDHFYADPFVFEKDGKHYLFFEDLDHATQKGIISVVEFDENGPTGPARTCLEEDYHLSYPNVFEHEGEILMIPETSNNGDVAIYAAEAFPFGWKRKAVLLENIDAADVTIERYNGKLWMFCVTRDAAGGYSDCLSIFYADDLYGPWQPHKQNPVLIDKATARPAGNMKLIEGELWRPVQDCTSSYGAAMGLARVTRLDDDEFDQVIETHLTPGGAWPGRKLHSLNRAGKLEVIDGAALRPKASFLRPYFERKYAP